MIYKDAELQQRKPTYRLSDLHDAYGIQRLVLPELVLAAAATVA